MTVKKSIIAGVILAALCLLGWFWMSRGSSEADDPKKAVAGAGDVTAAVAVVDRRAITNTLTISGEFRPFQDVDVHAKVAGYIKVIYVDVGDHVKEGQTLAILEVPELAAQLAGADAGARRAMEEIGRAQGDLERAKSTHAAMHSAYARLN